MAQVVRGGEFLGTFKANATMSTLHTQAYITGAGQVGEVTTHTQIAVGTVREKSTGGANSSVVVNLFQPTRIGIGRGVIAAGDQVGNASATTGYITCVTSGVAPVGVAISAVSVTGEYFEFAPVLMGATIT